MTEFHEQALLPRRARGLTFQARDHETVRRFHEAAFAAGGGDNRRARRAAVPPRATFRHL